jgi:adenosine/AMP kinase
MAITDRARRAKAQAMQRECDAWNAAHPVGSEVLVKRDGIDEPVATTTRSAAQILSGHSVVIWLTGISGCYLLSHVRATPTPLARDAAMADLKRCFSR